MEEGKDLDKVTQPGVSGTPPLLVPKPVPYHLECKVYFYYYLIIINLNANTLDVPGAFQIYKNGPFQYQKFASFVTEV